MKRCLNKECSKCNQSYPDDFECCPKCGVDLVLESENSNIRMGNANAISGGVHSSDDHSKKDSENVVNSNNETHTNSHNTTNNTTIYEAEKSASEKLEENRLKYRLECKALFRDGLISKDEERQLRELQANLNLADELVFPIKEEIRKQSKSRKTQLPETGLCDIRQAKSIIEQNIAPALQRQLVKLESWMQEYDDNTLKFMYYQMSSMLEHVRYTNRYEDGVKDEYWEIYWAYIAYGLQSREKQADEALASLCRWHARYPEQNDVLLLLVGRMMRNEPIEDVRQVRGMLTGHYTPDLQLLTDAIDELLNMDWAREYVSVRPAHAFYINTLFANFVETQKAVGEQQLKEIRRQKEQERKDEQKRIHEQELARQAAEKAKAEADAERARAEAEAEKARQDRLRIEREKQIEARRIAQEAEVRRQKNEFVKSFQNNQCDLLKTCAEIGVDSLTFSDWNKSDRIFADKIKYYQRLQDADVRKMKAASRKAAFKKAIPVISVVLLLLAAGTVAVAIYNRHVESERLEMEYLEAEKRAEKRLDAEHEELISQFDAVLSGLHEDLEVNELDNVLKDANAALLKLKSFEDANSVQVGQFSGRKDSLLDKCKKLESYFDDLVCAGGDPETNKLNEQKRKIVARYIK